MKIMIHLFVSFGLYVYQNQADLSFNKIKQM